MIDISHITPQGQAGLEIKHVLAEIIAAIDGGGTGGDGITGIIVDGSSLPIDSGNVTLGNASLLSTGSEEGDVVVLSSDGKIDSALLPSISITDTVVCSDGSITTEEELKTWAEGQGLEQGDMIIVSNGTDLTGTYVVLSDGSLQAISTPSAGAITGITVNGDAVSVDNGVASIVDVVFTDDLKDYATKEYVDEQVEDINKLIDETKEAVEGDIDTKTSTLATKEEVKEVEEKIPDVSSFITEDAVDTKLADYAKKTDIADFITADAVAETYATKSSLDSLNTAVGNLDTMVDGNTQSITDIRETYATKAEIPDVSNFTEKELTDVSAYTVNQITTTSSGNVAEIFNENGGGGARFKDVANNVTSYTGVNDGTSEGIYAQLYAKDSTSGKGSRLNVYTDMICYSNTATSAAGWHDEDHEIATKADINKAIAEIGGVKKEVQYNPDLTLDGDVYTWVITHTLNTEDLTISIFKTSDAGWEVVGASVIISDDSTITVTISSDAFDGAETVEANSLKAIAIG